MKKRNFLLCVMAICGSTMAQSTLLQEDPGAEKNQPTNGPNLKNFKHFYVSFGLVDAIKEDYADFEFGKSNEITIGQRYKRKITNWYSVGITAEFAITNYHVNPDSLQFLNSNKELIRTNNLGIGLYNRFNYGRRGNRIGKFVEFGLYGQWAMNIKEVYDYDYFNSARAKLKVVNPDYYNRLNYGFNAAVGFNRYVLTFRYRLSELVKNSQAPYQGVPPIVFGLQIGIHK